MPSRLNHEDATVISLSAVNDTTSNALSVHGPFTLIMPVTANASAIEVQGSNMNPITGLGPTHGRAGSYEDNADFKNSFTKLGQLDTQTTNALFSYDKPVRYIRLVSDKAGFYQTAGTKAKVAYVYSDKKNV